MRSLLTILVSILLLSSCINQRKVNRWLDEHPTQAAGYCADNFPPDTITRVETKGVDSSGYKEATNNMQDYADSLFRRLNSLQNAPLPATTPCPPRLNLDSLKREVDREIRRRLTPCVDSIVYVTNTVVDRARETQLRGIIEEKDKTISARDKRVTDLEVKVKAKNKWIWAFWILAAIAGLYVLLKAKGLLKFLP